MQTAGETPAPPLQTAGQPPASQPPGDPMGMLRVLDAAANRAQEALRIVEDYTRLVLDDGHLTKVCKDLRHELAAALVAIPFDHRLAARETLCDVGTVLDTSSEWRRDDAGSVLRANFARLEQSLRRLGGVRQAIRRKLRRGRSNNCAIACIRCNGPRRLPAVPPGGWHRPGSTR